MRSPTQLDLAPSTVTALVADALGTGVRDCAELSGGGFATVWRASLSDGREVVAKVGPGPGVRLLSYEEDMIGAEAEYLRLAHGRAPVPDVLWVGRIPSLVDSDVVITTLLPGTPLTALPEGSDDRPARRDLGATVARIHGVTGARFGYSGARAHGATWREAFGEMVASLLRDGAEWGVAVPAGSIRAALDRHALALAEITTPSLVHFDLWDGNILASLEGTGTYRLTGMVDGERYLFGDPLVDFVSPALGRRIEDLPDHPFLAGYGEVDLASGSALARLGLYRLYMDILLLVEMPSRGMTTPSDEERRVWATDLLEQQLAELA